MKTKKHTRRLDPIAWTADQRQLLWAYEHARRSREQAPSAEALRWWADWTLGLPVVGPQP